MKKKGANFYTFIFIPDSGKVKRYTFSKNSVKVIAGLFIFSIISTMSFIIVFPHYLSLMKEKKNLEQETISQAEKITGITQKLKSLEMRLAYVENLGKKVKYIALGKEGENSSLFLGIGGMGTMNEKPVLDISTGESILEMRLSALQQRMESQEDFLDTVFTLLADKKSILDSTPSVWPVKGWITSEFGFRVDPFTGRNEFHQGLDIAARYGTPVIAPADGIVIYSRYERTYGNVVIIDHGYDYSTLFAHLAEVYVKQGDILKRGDVIGAVGDTGKTTGSHLHYEVRKNGIPVDPRDFILE